MMELNECYHGFCFLFPRSYWQCLLHMYLCGLDGGCGSIGSVNCNEREKTAEAYLSGKAFSGLFSAFHSFSSKDALSFSKVRPFTHSLISQEVVKIGRASVSVVFPQFTYFQCMTAI